MEYYILEEVETNSFHKAQSKIIEKGISPDETNSAYVTAMELLGDNAEIGINFISNPCRKSWLKFQALIQLNPRRDLGKILTIINAAIAND